ncbi:Hypothetical_protein [Hexamita inflata]|uniref:Hypothetical_protein n=1 Tax=Hexamita inflata TaxID=28002 RepID=A0ABP1IKC7_9EUKA
MCCCSNRHILAYSLLLAWHTSCGTCYKSPSIYLRLEIEVIFLFIQSHSLEIFAQYQCLLLVQDVGNKRSRSIWKYPSIERNQGKLSQQFVEILKSKVAFKITGLNIK